MGYADQKFYSRPLEALLVAGTGTATGTTTGTAATANPNAFPRVPAFIRRTQINRIRVVVSAAQSANFTGSRYAFLNGTNTFAVATIGTAAANTTVDATVIATFSGTAASGTELVNPLSTITNPAGQVYTVIAGINTNAIFNAGTGITVALIGSATAAAHAGPGVDIWFEAQEAHV